MDPDGSMDGLANMYCLFLLHNRSMYVHAKVCSIVVGGIDLLFFFQ